MILSFVIYDTIFLNKSYVWLNDPEVKRLTMAPDIDKENQIEWFESLQNRKDYYIRGIMANGVPIGAMGIKKIDLNNLVGESWLYIGERDYWGKGIGYIVIQEIISVAKSMGLKELIAKVLSDNDRSIMLHKKCGYVNLMNSLEKKQKVLIMRKTL